MSVVIINPLSDEAGDDPRAVTGRKHIPGTFHRSGWSMPGNTALHNAGERFLADPQYVDYKSISTGIAARNRTADPAFVTVPSDIMPGCPALNDHSAGYPS